MCGPIHIPSLSSLCLQKLHLTHLARGATDAWLNCLSWWKFPSSVVTLAPACFQGILGNVKIRMDGRAGTPPGQRHRALRVPGACSPHGSNFTNPSGYQRPPWFWHLGHRYMSTELTEPCTCPGAVLCSIHPGKRITLSVPTTPERGHVLVGEGSGSHLGGSPYGFAPWWGSDIMGGHQWIRHSPPGLRGGEAPQLLAMPLLSDVCCCRMLLWGCPPRLVRRTYDAVAATAAGYCPLPLWRRMSLPSTCPHLHSQGAPTTPWNLLPHKNTGTEWYH